MKHCYSPTVLEQIKEQRAIGFAKWLRIECYDVSGIYHYSEDDEPYSIEQLYKLYLESL